MLHILEDQRPVALAERKTTTDEGTADDHTPDCLAIQELLTISLVCTVGVNTVPISKDVDVGNVTLLILDVSMLAGQ